jgi:spore protease
MERARTDLAVEARNEYMEKYARTHGGEADGISFLQRSEGACLISELDVLNKEGEKAVGRAQGKYVTLEFGDITAADFASFSSLCTLCSHELRALCKGAESALVCGLGNSRLSADSLGPLALSHVLVTRSLRECEPEIFKNSGFAEVSAIAPGVGAETGFCAADIVRAAADKAKPDVVIAIDALAAREAKRLCRTVQICTVGIAPGSGVGNARTRLDYESVGAPVISIGVPTVVDVTTLVRDVAGIDKDCGSYKGLFVCPSDIDAQSARLAALIGFSVNLAFQKSYPLKEMMLG